MSYQGGKAASATTATIATNATNVATTTKSDNVTYYPVFAPANSTSNQNVNVGPLTYNPSTSTLTATTFSGALTGNATTSSLATIASSATNATNVGTTTKSDNVAYNVLMAGANSTSNQAARVTAMTYNPSTKSINGLLNIVNSGNTITFPTATGTLWASGSTNVNTTQPAFYAYMDTAGSVTNVTGDGTRYTPILNQTRLNQGTNYDTSSGIFTAPVTGLYRFSSSIFFTSLGALHTNLYIFLSINSAADGFILMHVNPNVQAISGFVSFNVGQEVYLSASDTVRMRVDIEGSTKTVGIGSFDYPSQETFFSGFLVC